VSVHREPIKPLVLSQQRPSSFTSLRPRAWRSLRLRFTVAISVLVIGLAATARFVHYRATVELLAWHVDELLWARLAGLATERAVSPLPAAVDIDMLDIALPDIRTASDRRPSRFLRTVIPAEADPGPDSPDFAWFAGGWDAGGRLLFSRQLPPSLAYRAAWEDRANRLWTSRDGRYRLAATRDQEGTLLVVGTPTAWLAEADREAAFFHAWTLAVAIPPGVVAGWLLLAWLLRPLDRISRTAQRIEAGHFGERIDFADVDVEIAGLAGAINLMLDRLGEVRDKLARFDANLAHELLGPVHGILLQAEVTLDGDPEPAEMRHGLRSIRSLGRRLETICEALLAYSRTVLPDPAALSRLDLEPIVDAAVGQVAGLAEAERVALVNRVGSAVVRGEADLLQQVFANLLTNAILHSPAGGGVAIENETTPEGVAVSVIDHGAGVAPEDEPRIFEQFFSGGSSAGDAAPRPGGDRPAGHGLGLAICRSIMQSHGGEVGYRATPGGGATFVARFPAADRDLQQNGASDFAGE